MLELLTEKLSEIGDLGQGTMASLIVQKKGMIRGAQGDKETYDNDKVHVLLWAGFHYKALVGRTYNKLNEFWDQGNFYQSLLTAVRAVGHPEVTLKDVSEAVLETNDALLKVLDSGCAPTEEKSLTWEPLKIGGFEIKGAKVYVGQGGSAPSAPVKGNVYLDGVKLGEKVLEKAEPWKANKKAKTVAKEILRSWLPVGFYVRYCLAPENLQELQIGKKASEAAMAAQIVINPEAVRSLFKIAI
jgi:hypothetical protein